MMKKLFSSLLLCTVLCSVSYSQLDSISVSVSFTLETDSTVIDSAAVATDFMTVNVSVNDPMLIGNIMVSVYEQQSGHPMARTNLSLTALQSAGHLVGNTFSIPIGFLESSLSYEIRTSVQNFQLGYLPEVVTSYP